MKVAPIKLIDDEGSELSLTLEMEYEVLGIEADYYRILTDEDSKPYGNDPVLYNPNCFRITDDTRPTFWICEKGEDGEEYCYPPEWNKIGFFEDYHDGIEEILNQFWSDLKRYYPDTWRERINSR